MEQKVHFKYLNTQLNIGMFDIKNVYLLSPKLIKLQPQVYKGKLVYREKGSAKRISYSRIKEGLERKTFYIIEKMPF
jgi:hypothetical protein